MNIGICVSHREAAQVAGGYDFIEENIQRFLMPLASDGDFAPELADATSCGFTIPAANSFYPGKIKTVGSEMDSATILSYARTSFSRAKLAGIRIMVFGSGGSRALPDGVSATDAASQFAAALSLIAPAAAENGITIVVEPLNRAECNFINSLAEGAAIVRSVNHPSVRLLADIYHMMREDEGPQEIRNHAAIIRHVHIAERKTRSAPGVAGDDFLPYLRALKESGYTGDISLECRWTDLAGDSAIGIRTLRRQLAEAGY